MCVTSGWQISPRQAQIIAAVLIFTSFLFSAPSVIIHGVFTRRSPRPKIYGYECFLDDTYAFTKMPLAFCVVLIILFIVCCSAILVMYIRVGAKVWHHSRAIRKSTYYPVADGSSNSDGAGTSSSTSTSKLAMGVTGEEKQELTTNLCDEQKQESREDHEEQSKKLETIGENTGEASRKEESEKEERLQNKGMGTTQPIGVENRTKTVHFQISEPFKEENKPKGSENERNNETAEDVRMMEAIHSYRGGVQSEEQQSTTGIILRSQDCNANKNDPQATDSDKHCKVSKSGLSEEAKLNGDAIKSHAHFGNRKKEPKIKCIRDMEILEITYCWREKRPLESDAGAQKVTPNEGMILKLNSTSCNHEVPQGDNFLYKVLNCMKMSSDTSSQPRRKSKNMKQRKTSCCATTPRDLTKDDENNHSRTDLSETGKRNLKRTTIMLITISVVFIVGFIPYLAVVSYYFGKPELYATLNGKDLAIYNLFIRFPSINCAANFVIYYFCDLAFRRKCVSLLRQKLLCFRS